MFSTYKCSREINYSSASWTNQPRSNFLEQTAEDSDPFSFFPVTLSKNLDCRVKTWQEVYRTTYNGKPHKTIVTFIVLERIQNLYLNHTEGEQILFAIIWTKFPKHQGVHRYNQSQQNIPWKSAVDISVQGLVAISILILQQEE